MITMIIMKVTIKTILMYINNKMKTIDCNNNKTQVLITIAMIITIIIALIIIITITFWGKIIGVTGNGLPEDIETLLANGNKYILL